MFRKLFSSPLLTLGLGAIVGYVAYKYVAPAIGLSGFRYRGLGTTAYPGVPSSLYKGTQVSKAITTALQGVYNAPSGRGRLGIFDPPFDDVDPRWSRVPGYEYWPGPKKIGPGQMM